MKISTNHFVIWLVPLELDKIYQIDLWRLVCHGQCNTGLAVFDNKAAQKFLIRRSLNQINV